MQMKLTALWRRARNAGLISLCLLVMGVLSFRSAVADWNDVPTGSMQPTILIGDRIFVNKLAYDLKLPFTGQRLATWGDPARGDVVICWSPVDGTRLVKRVVGVPGDVIALRNNRLVVNDREVAYEVFDDDCLAASMDKSADEVTFLREGLPGRSHVVALSPPAGAARNMPPVRVPAGRYLLMGDNRDRSADSRYFGLVGRDDIVGRVQGVVASLDLEHGWRPRWERFFSRLI